MSILSQLSEGIVRRDMKAETAALEEKWSETGLLEGLHGTHKTNMALMLENEAAELIREASTMAGGDVEGFASVAFPLVRRIFGKAIANKLVSVQPMSLPAGLIFFLDFTYNATRLGNTADESVYGGGVVGRDLINGVQINDLGNVRYAEKGFLHMNNGYSSATGTLSSKIMTVNTAVFEVGASATNDALIKFDPDLASGSFATILAVSCSLAEVDAIDQNLMSLVCTIGNTLTHSGSTQVRRLTTFDRTTQQYRFVFAGTGTFGALSGTDFLNYATVNYTRKDAFDNALGLGAIVGTSPWDLEAERDIPELNIKVDQVPVTAKTKKLKAKWTPELSQDLNAFHSVDAEVELTSVLADHVELEINGELLGDLVQYATAGKMYWSRRPGKFVNHETGADLSSATLPPDFTGDVEAWYRTLMDIINHLSAVIHRKVKKGGANFIVCGPEVAGILEMIAGFKANVAVDDDTGEAGIDKVGTLRKKWDIYVDSQFYRNVMLVGRKGNGFLESGYVYAPYVPLQTTPTLFDPEDFTPRKGVMTRYAKKMVRPDFYGLIIIQDLMG